MSWLLGAKVPPRDPFCPAPRRVLFAWRKFMVEAKTLTARQAAELLITSPRTVYRLIDSGQLAGKKIGNKYRTTDVACIAYLHDPRDPVSASAGEHKGEILCQSPSEAASGTVISLRRQGKELDDLLVRGTRNKRRSCTTS
ncbi:helix-turn-helix domain-containing protein [Enterobacter hormaechei]|uniref:helix-turn-helix domain-containing protein n=1 Tax=Enterobacter hormaechei TaxID=158836 RepID=UPI00287765ED|nr:helix-turn-helix domain-containing protein [Enterobacter hormaechei]